MPDTLEILIKTVADLTGAKLTQEQITSLKDGLDKMGETGSKAGIKVGQHTLSAGTEMRHLSLLVGEAGRSIEQGFNPQQLINFARHLSLVSGGMQALAAIPGGIFTVTAILATVGAAWSHYSAGAKAELEKVNETIKQHAENIAELQKIKVNIFKTGATGELQPAETLADERKQAMKAAKTAGDEIARLQQGKRFEFYDVNTPEGREEIRQAAAPGGKMLAESSVEVKRRRDLEALELAERQRAAALEEVAKIEKLHSEEEAQAILKSLDVKEKDLELTQQQEKADLELALAKGGNKVKLEAEAAAREKTHAQERNALRENAAADLDDLGAHKKAAGIRTEIDADRKKSAIEATKVQLDQIKAQQQAQKEAAQQAEALHKAHLDFLKAQPKTAANLIAIGELEVAGITGTDKTAELQRRAIAARTGAEIRDLNERQTKEAQRLSPLKGGAIAGPDIVKTVEVAMQEANKINQSLGETIVTGMREQKAQQEAFQKQVMDLIRSSRNTFQ